MSIRSLALPPAILLEINVGSVLHANEIIAAQRLVKNWVAHALDDYQVIPMEHLRTVFHVQTEQTPRLSQQEFKKRMSRNNINAQRKREFGAEREAAGIRGVVVHWQSSRKEQELLTSTYFDDQDQRLLASA